MSDRAPPPGDTSLLEAGAICLFGCGHMGRAMLDGWLRGGVSPSRLIVIDPAATDLPAGVQAAAPDARFATLLLAVKPQALGAVADEVRARLAPGATLLSVLAGIECASLQALFPEAAPVRLMPNLAAALGKAPLGLWSDAVDASGRARIAALLAPLGTPVWLAREADMAVFTALAGSGPAFLYRMIDALAEGAAALGLAPELAAETALATIEGAALLARQADAPPAALADRVASKGGSTRAGLDVLDADAALAVLIHATLAAATARNIALAAEASRS